jgi:hypothetical protein
MTARCWRSPRLQPLAALAKSTAAIINPHFRLFMVRTTYTSSVAFL